MRACVRACTCFLLTQWKGGVVSDSSRLHSIPGSALYIVFLPPTLPEAPMLCSGIQNRYPNSVVVCVGSLPRTDNTAFSF